MMVLPVIIFGVLFLAIALAQRGAHGRRRRGVYDTSWMSTTDSSSDDTFARHHATAVHDHMRAHHDAVHHSTHHTATHHTDASSCHSVSHDVGSCTSHSHSDFGSGGDFGGGHHH